MLNGKEQIEKFDVLIVGGGVIGTACARELAMRGCKVAVVERSQQTGLGCSYANAGWVTPCFALPLPMPGMLLQSLKWMLDSKSPLRIQPRLSFSLLSWLTRFLLHMNHRSMQSAAEALVEVSKESLKLFHELQLSSKGKIELEQKGLLMVAQSAKGLQAAYQELDVVGQWGIPGLRVSSQEACEREPLLRQSNRGGVYFSAEAHVEPFLVVDELTKQAKQHGCEFFFNTEVYDFMVEAGAIRGIRATNGNYQADKIVLATGSWSKSIAENLGIHVPILGGKGYSFVTRSLKSIPKQPLMLLEKKVAITPRKDSTRIAGTLELVDQDDQISAGRVQAMVDGAKSFLEWPENFSVQELWRGLRPCTPDGLPLIGKSSVLSNLHFACGHQMLGLQSSLGTGKLLAQEVLGEKTFMQIQSFSPGRFNC